MRACEPSQNGLVSDAPQRHNRADCVRNTVRPVPLQISTLPFSCNGPLGTGVIDNAPPRSARGSDGRVAGSPVAAKPAAVWLPSQ